MKDAAVYDTPQDASFTRTHGSAGQAQLWHALDGASRVIAGAARQDAELRLAQRAGVATSQRESTQLRLVTGAALQEADARAQSRAGRRCRGAGDDAAQVLPDAPPGARTLWRAV